MSSHNYLLLNESKKSSKKEESKGEIKTNINNNMFNNLNKFTLKGTLKVDKVHYLMKDEGKKLFEDINLQYIEPLEGGEDESEEQDDGTYRRYLNNVNEELNQKKENIVFVQDLGLSNNRLNINDLFDKIKKKSRFKTRNSFLSVNRPKQEEIIPVVKEIEPKKIIPKKRALGFKAIKKLFVTKNDLKNFFKTGKRMLTLDIRKNLHNYYKIKHTLLNIRERKAAVRKNNSQKIFKKIGVGQNLEGSEKDIFGNKKKNKIKDSLSLLDSSKKASKVIEENKKEEEKPKADEKKEEKKDEADEKIKKLSPKNKIKKKKGPVVNQKKKITKEKKSNIFNRNQTYRAKGTLLQNINKFNMDQNNQSKFKSPAINSILRDIKDLSQSILTNRIKKTKEKKNRTILYDKHFGYEYWKENEIRKNLCYNSTKNKHAQSFRSFYSPNKEADTFSVMSSTFSWLFNPKNGDDIPDYETDFTSGIRENAQNPYSINWTKNIIQNSYHRKIKLRNNNKGVPKIELVRVQSSIPYTNREKITYDKSKNANKMFRKTNSMFGRIYKNNEVEFPVIKNF